MFMRKTCLLAFLCIGLTAAAQDTTHKLTPAADTASIHPFTLGQVVVIGGKPALIGTTINAQQLQRFNRTDVSHALGLLPGVSLTAVGPRNESAVYVRGFDLRSAPLLLDGIPIYEPYDGYVDLARFTTFDLSELTVSKGYTSVLYGPNAVGGAINLVTRRPVRPLEISGATGWLTGGYRSDLRVGSDLGRFYVQAGISRIQRDSFPVSKDFVPTKTQPAGYRVNSYSRDEKVDVKIGFTPNAHSEYALNYIDQHGTKGVPVYTGHDSLNSQLKSPRYWKWPYWDKQSFYFLSNTGIDSTQYVKTRLYYDQFKNEIDSYDNGTYTTITRPYAFRSIYNDYTFGGIAEYGKRFAGGRDILKGTLQYRQDVHREHNVGQAVREMSDGTTTVGIENELSLTRDLKLLTGFSFANRTSIEAQNYISSTNSITDFPHNNNNAWNLQGALEYKTDADGVLSFSVARKTRFATIKDRYSYSLGAAIPNPNLTPEYSVNYDLGYKRTLVRWLVLESSLFYSHIDRTILTVNNVQYDSTTHVWQSQVQNVGRSEYIGGEIGFEAPLSSSVRLGTNYTYIKRNDLSNPSILFTDVPRNKWFGYAQYSFRDLFYIEVNGEYDSKRYGTSYGAVAGAFSVFNAVASYHVWKYFSVEGGINNIFDRNYSLVEGYPEPGRNYFVNLRYRY